MTLIINYMSNDDIDARRQELLEEANMTVDELRARASAYLLDSRQSSILFDLEDLDYLESASKPKSA